MFACVTVGALLFIYGSLKAVSLMGMRRLKACLADLEQGVLDHSEEMERSRKRYLRFWGALFILLFIALILGILKALGYFFPMADSLSSSPVRPIELLQ